MNGSAVEKDKLRPWFNWYDWRTANWNTKWGAYDCYTIIGKSYIKFIFNTAWNVATPIFHRLEILGYDMEIKYADEDLGINYGSIEFVSEHKNWIEHPLINPRNFALKLWERY